MNKAPASQATNELCAARPAAPPSPRTTTTHTHAAGRALALAPPHPPPATPPRSQRERLSRHWAGRDLDKVDIRAPKLAHVDMHHGGLSTTHAQAATRGRRETDVKVASAATNMRAPEASLWSGDRQLPLAKRTSAPLYVGQQLPAKDVIYAESNPNLAGAPSAGLDAGGIGSGANLRADRGGRNRHAVGTGAGALDQRGGDRFMERGRSEKTLGYNDFGSGRTDMQSGWRAGDTEAYRLGRAPGVASSASQPVLPTRMSKGGGGKGDGKDSCFYLGDQDPANMKPNPPCGRWRAGDSKRFTMDGGSPRAYPGFVEKPLDQQAGMRGWEAGRGDRNKGYNDFGTGRTDQQGAWRMKDDLHFEDGKFVLPDKADGVGYKGEAVDSSLARLAGGHPSPPQRRTNGQSGYTLTDIHEGWQGKVRRDPKQVGKHGRLDQQAGWRMGDTKPFRFADGSMSVLTPRRESRARRAEPRPTGKANVPVSEAGGPSAAPEFGKRRTNITNTLASTIRRVADNREYEHDQHGQWQPPGWQSAMRVNNRVLWGAEAGAKEAQHARRAIATDLNLNKMDKVFWQDRDQEKRRNFDEEHKAGNGPKFGRKEFRHGIRPADWDLLQY